MVACRKPAPFNFRLFPATMTWSGNFTPLISVADALPLVSASKASA